MKLYNKPQSSSLEKCLKGLQLLAQSLQQELKRSTVVSADERELVGKSMNDVIETVTSVLQRTQRTQQHQAAATSLRENTELYRMKDTELAAKWDGLQNDVGYLVGLSTTMLERLYNTRHLKEGEYESLKRYWRSIVVQHLKLLERWKLAID